MNFKEDDCKYYKVSKYQVVSYNDCFGYTSEIPICLKKMTIINKDICNFCDFYEVNNVIKKKK